MGLDRFHFLRVIIVLSAVSLALGQQPPAPQATPAPKEQAQPDKKPPVMESPSARLLSAHNVVLLRTRGSGTPAEVIRSTMEGWGRFEFVDTPEKADIIVEVASSGDGGSLVVSSSSNNSPLTRQPEQSSSARRDISPATINLTVRDARNKRVLFTAMETVKSGMTEKARDNHTVEASERLARKFHDRLEPPPAK